MDRMLTVKELQEVLHIGRDRAYNLMRSSCFPSMIIGTRYYVSQSNLEKWINTYAYKEFKL